MAAEKVQCIAITQAGTRCRNQARQGYRTCYVHAAQEPAAIPAAPPATTPPPAAVPPPASFGARPAPATPDAKAKPASKAKPDAARSQLEMLVTQLNLLADELQKLTPGFVPPPFTPRGMMDLVESSMDKLDPRAEDSLLAELRRNLEGTSPKDLIDPETYKGLWYVLHYMAQARTVEVRSQLFTRLSSLPGASVVQELAHNLEGTSPKDFLDPETWKGTLLVINYTLMGAARDFKRRLLGEEE